MRRGVFIAAAFVCLAACQQYNFNPVGKCIIQPGSARIQLSSVTTADILFVVDDSGSMYSEQKRLADNFGAFIGALADLQKARKATGLDPLEYHIAITTSSVFEAYGATTLPAGTPPDVCGQPTGGQCSISTPYNGWTDPACWGTASDPSGPGGAACAWKYIPEQPYACAPTGEQCVDVIDRYWAACGAGQFGQGVRGSKYPAGDFMAYPSIAAADAQRNPRVLHFTKNLAWDTWGTAAVDPAITALVTQFQQNISVGACGSGMEQHFQGGRLAVQKALAGQQPGISSGEWPHPGAKLVVVWVGDEDDCSNPSDPNKALAFTPWTNSTTSDPNPPGNDVCIRDQGAAAAGQPYKMYSVKEFLDYFTGLGRPFGAAFIYSAQLGTDGHCLPDGKGGCSPGTCICQPGTPGACDATCAVCQTTNPNAACYTDCSGKIPLADSRFHQLSASLRNAGKSTLEASVCDADFATTLKDIAQLAAPPPGLTLPSQPASTQVALLQIQSADGKSTRLCTGPGAGMDWQFVDCKSGAAAPAGTTTSCITIDHSTGHCEANPGETYIAQYLGMVPAGGCAVGASGAPSDECAAALGGTGTQWTCAGPAGGRGTCLCTGSGT